MHSGNARIRILMSNRGGNDPRPLTASILASFRGCVGQVGVTNIILIMGSLPTSDVGIHIGVCASPLAVSGRKGHVRSNDRPIGSTIAGCLGKVLCNNAFGGAGLISTVRIISNISSIRLKQYRCGSNKRAS